MRLSAVIIRLEDKAVFEELCSSFTASNPASFAPLPLCLQLRWCPAACREACRLADELISVPSQVKRG
jgi:hypothetical protein